jgi:hypothetical protein
MNGGNTQSKLGKEEKILGQMQDYIWIGIILLSLYGGLEALST